MDDEERKPDRPRTTDADASVGGGGGVSPSSG